MKKVKGLLLLVCIVCTVTVAQAAGKSRELSAMAVSATVHEVKNGNGHAGAQIVSVSVQDSALFALKYSPQLQQAQENKQQALHEVRRAEAGYYPTIGVWGGFGLSQSDDESTRQSKEQGKVVGTGDAGATLSQSLWQGGATSALVRSRNAFLQAQNHMVMDNATMLVFNAVTSHMDVLRRRKLVGLAEENVRQHKDILRLVQARFDQGIASSGEVDQLRSRVLRAEATLVTHRMGLDAALNNYTRVTGQPVQRRMENVPLPKLAYDTVNLARDDSVRHNARIRAEMANIRAALGERDYAKAGFSPRLGVDAGPTYSDVGYKGKNHVWTWNAMLNMRWDIYSGGADMAAFSAASAKVRALRKGLHSYMDLLDEELRSTFTRTRELRRQSKLYGEAQQASRRSRENFYQQFQAGQRGLLDVLDAESEFFYSSVEEEVSGTDSVLGQYRLLALSGRLLEVMGLPTDFGQSSAEETGSVWNFSPSSMDENQATKDSLLRVAP